MMYLLRILTRTTPVLMLLLLVQPVINPSEAIAQTPRERACTAEYLLPRVLGGHIFGKFTGRFGPRGKLLGKKLNPFPGLNDIANNCIFCVLDEATGTGSCNENWGDPHLITQDGLRYDFQGEGDYALVTAPGLEVQARYTAWGTVSFLTALAVRAGDNTIVVGDSQRAENPVTVNGTEIPLAPGDWVVLENGAGHVRKFAEGSIIRIKIENVVDLWVGSSGGSLARVNVDDSFNGTMQGLFGNANGDPNDDLQTLAGIPVDANDPAQLYGQFRQDWLRTGADSFFNTPFVATRTPGELIGSSITLASISASARTNAETQCIAAGIESGMGLDECIYDLAVTGDNRWLEDALVVADAAANSIAAAGLTAQVAAVIPLTNIASVSPDQPAPGAGKLDGSSAADKYSINIPATEKRVLVSRSPCSDSAAPLIQIAGPNGNLTEASLTCNRATVLPTGSSTITVFSSAGTALDYAFDIIAPTINDIGTIEPNVVRTGSLVGGQITRATLTTALNGKTVFLDSLASASCGNQWQLQNAYGAGLSQVVSVCKDIGPVKLDGVAPFQLELVGQATGTDYQFRVVDVFNIPASVPSTNLISGNAIVSGMANLYLAGMNEMPDDTLQGILPASQSIRPTGNAVLRMKTVSGTVNCCGSTNPQTAADGEVGNTNIIAANGISPVIVNRTLFLAGLFIDATQVATPDATDAPPPMSYPMDVNDTARFNPLPGQIFYIGDGVTTDGMSQEFTVPNSATHFYLGFADGFGFFGTPSAYHDNTGELTVSWEIGAARTTGNVQAPTIVESLFEQTNEQWTIKGDAQGAAHAAATSEFDQAGNGFISATDDAAGGTWYFSAPAKYLADKSAYYGGSLSFELKTNTTSNPFTESDIVIVSSTVTLFTQLPRLPESEFTAFVVPLTEANWIDEGGASPDAATFKSVLGNIDELLIRGEYQLGADVGGLDSVKLSR